mgnify:CR=1 FL=1
MTPIRNDAVLRSVDVERTPSLTPSFQHQVVSSCRKETQEERELTPSNAKLKIIPQRPSKCGSRRNLRRQRSLRMQQQFPCRSASKPSSSTSHFSSNARPATISELSSCMAPSLSKWDGSDAAMCDLVKRMRRTGVCSSVVFENTTFFSFLLCHS